METNNSALNCWIAAQAANEAALARVQKQQRELVEAERRIREALANNQVRIDTELSDMAKFAMQSAEVILLEPFPPTPAAA